MILSLNYECLPSQLFADLLKTTEEKRLPTTDDHESLTILLGQFYPKPARNSIDASNIGVMMRLSDKYDCPDVMSACVDYIHNTMLTQIKECSDTSRTAVLRKIRLLLDFSATAKRCNLEGIEGNMKPMLPLIQHKTQPWKIDCINACCLWCRSSCS